MLRNVFMSIVLLVLAGWGFISVYNSQVQFAEIVLNDIEPPWEVTMNVLPIIALLIIGGGWYLWDYFYYKKRNKKRESWAKRAFLPYEFEEGDEREIIITAKATRAAYISMWVSIPFLMTLFFLYPFISETVPYFPIIVFLLLPIIQIITYAVSWRKHYKL